MQDKSGPSGKKDLPAYLKYGIVGAMAMANKKGSTSVTKLSKRTNQSPASKLSKGA